MEEELITPLFMHDEPGPRWNAGEMARITREPGEDEKAVAAQYRGFTARRLVHVRATAGGGRTAANLCAPSDAAVAKILRVVSAFGVADNQFLQAVSTACYAWTKDRAHLARCDHPVTDALHGFTQGEFWSLRDRKSTRLNSSH